MLPVDTAPFRGPRRAADAALSLAGARVHTFAGAKTRPPRGVDATASREFPGQGPRPQADSGTLAYDADPRRSRLTRDARVARWRERRPLLDEDPREGELDRPPLEGLDAAPFADLTPLGRRLVGLDDWPDNTPPPSDYVATTTPPPPPVTA